MVELGILASISYVTDKGDGPIEYVHKFGPGTRLVVDPVNKRLGIVGTGYKVNERGIVG